MHVPHSLGLHVYASCRSELLTGPAKHLASTSILMWSLMTCVWARIEGWFSRLTTIEARISQIQCGNQQTSLSKYKQPAHGPGKPPKTLSSCPGILVWAIGPWESTSMLGVFLILHDILNSLKDIVVTETGHLNVYFGILVILMAVVKYFYIAVLFFGYRWVYEAPC